MKSQLQSSGRKRNFAEALGVIVTSSSVPRVAGEIGDPNSNPAGTLYETTVFEDFLREMREGLHPASLKSLIACRDVLVSRGAGCVTTSCGLLWPAQSSLELGCPVPFVSSSLCLLDRLRGKIPEGMCVVTVDAGFKPYWQSLHIPELKLGRDSYLYRALTGQVSPADFSTEQAERSILDRLHSYCAEFPETSGFILECTNLSPYFSSISAALGLPVYDIYDAIGVALAE